MTASRRAVCIAAAVALAIGTLSPTPVVAATSAPLAPQTLPAEVPPPPARTGDIEVTQLIVKYKPGVSPTESPGVATGDSEVTGVDLEPGRKMSLGMRTVELSEPLDVDEATVVSNELSTDPRVAFAEPDLPLFPVSATEPNDPYYLPNQWALHDTFGIDSPTAWAKTTGSSEVVVAVLDTGILDNLELNTETQVPGYDFITDEEMANDGNARDPDPTDNGDWVTQAMIDAGDVPDWCTPQVGSSWHGLHVAGTIGARTDNELGMAAVAPGIRLEPVRVLGRCGGLVSDIADAITWASGGSVTGAPVNSHPAQVINMSLGGGSSTCLDAFAIAINDAASRGTTVVAAAGNDGENASNFTPANCDNVVAVGATTAAGKRASYSNYGTTVDISAPGSSIVSLGNPGTTTPEDASSLKWSSGTSMATPHVAGIAALIKSMDSSATPAEIETRLRETASPFADGSCDVDSAKTCGAGILNGSAVPDAPSPEPDPSDTPSDPPTDEPTSEPTDQPTDTPSETPSEEPTDTPSETPTDEPTPVPSAPAQPLPPTAVARNRSAVVRWGAPDDGGATIVGYHVQVWQNATLQADKSCSTSSVAPDVAATTCTVTGLTNGVPYRFDVTASNSAGSGATSSQSGVTIPATTPSAVRALSISYARSRAVLRWAPPANNGGRPVTGYRWRTSVNLGRSWTAWRPSATRLVINRKRRAVYRVQVAAINAMGLGAVSTRTLRRY